MVNYFIARPIFAWVLAIMLMLCGLLSLVRLPVAQYPAIAPPTISIQVTYPGASAKTVQDTVVQVIEQQMNGLDRLQYISSESNSDGSMSIALTFEQGTDADTAQVQVQNKLALAQPMLPLEVQQQGIRVTKATTNFLMVLAFISTDGSMQRQDLADYVASYIQDPLSRTSGVGDFQLFGAPYAMRIWLNPAALVNYSLTATDVSDAIQEQNVEVSSGQLGGLPALPGQELTATVVGPSRLQTPEQFGQILLKTNPDGSRVLLSDVARIELGAQNYSTDSEYNGAPAVGLGIRLATNANALETARAVRATLDELRPFFPPGMEVVDAYDTIPFVSLSISNVIHTLIEAVVLVFVVMYVFLQNFRATLIPTLAVPVVLLGTFGVLAAFGYSINTLTMFGMVLAIGLLVDDAIVVVENVERIMHEEGLNARQATQKSMGQIAGALVGIAMVLSAVFLPMAFFGGATGVIYRQFSITIVSSMVLSVLVALIFTPALCATLLKPPRKGKAVAQGRVWRGFNRGMDNATQRYASTVTRGLNRPYRLMLIYLAIAIATGWLFTRIPTSFMPQEDQGMLFAQIIAPEGATAERTRTTLQGASDYLLQVEKENVRSVFAISGFNFGGRGQNAGMLFIRLHDWEHRQNKEQKAEALAARLNGVFAREFRDTRIVVVSPPAVRELGNVSGFNFQLMDRGGIGHERLLQARNQFLAAAQQSPLLSQVRPNGIEDAPQVALLIDREKVRALSVSIGEVNRTISIALGSGYVNDFVDRGRVKRVYVQGEAASRMLPQDLQQWFVRNDRGDMVPFSAFSSVQWQYGPQKLNRYNGAPSFNLQGQAAPGFSSGEAMAEMERIARTMPAGVGFEWTGLSFEERLSGAQTPALYAISLIIVFLCLAALYESWSVPAAVMLVVPLGLIGAIAATLLRGLDNDVYFQVGLLTTVGLAAKNAILIVEFAKSNFDAGATPMAAAVQAAKQRLRPILMTSLAFMLGVTPLVVASGAGSGSQNAIGTGIVGGMLTSTFLAIFFIPAFFVIMLKLFRVKRPGERGEEERLAEAGETTPGGPAL
ncbi:efflux RND transporter permease subunit [Klebsiella pneumoniae]|uniref:efflux RND transporter permease subunit n=1 Tax=Enterobacteriaceae TaxID=543 RepID=UPI0021DA9877|nr:efflux RND transporter permease subunit [Klebsiella pneumoniae]ELY2785154.1 efflux RND transporter permease subunit [Cronobacter turicensis]MCU8675168.1 efflux RND transporter permease subunit [Klebsiella pneumoniae]MCU8688527.1 efflux RND transporter permease subunit [Klebsiella pneumoniae]HCB0101321.1 efflux RND transporter permease subunit [Klebsiella pneumoniae]